MKLVYFNLRGLAETSRLILAYVGVEYEDFRYPFQVLDLESHQFLREDFKKDLEGGFLRRSMNKLPYLEVKDDNGHTYIIPQSKAIERYLASRYGLWGDSPENTARIDSICECIRDFKEEYQPYRKDCGEYIMDYYFREILPKKLEDLIELMDSPQDNDAAFCIGFQTSLADIVVYSFLTQFFTHQDKCNGVYTKYPRYRNLVAHIESNEGIKSWLEERPITPF